jgi:hypothetical protein
VSKKEKAKLNFFPRRFAHKLKIYLGEKQLSDVATIAFAAGIESAVARVLDPALKAATPEKRIRLQPKDIAKGLQTDPALGTVFNQIIPRSEYAIPAYATPRVKKSTEAVVAAAASSAASTAAAPAPAPAAATEVKTSA